MAGWSRSGCRDTVRGRRADGRRRLRGVAELAVSRYTSATDDDRRRCSRRSASSRSTSCSPTSPRASGSDRAARPAARQAGAGGLRATCATWPRRTSRPRTRSRFLGRGDVRPLRAGADRLDHPRSEFLTPYTPYQPEISQGGLQVMFEYQTAISELTGLPVSNASVYEGPSALAAAGYLAKLHQPGAHALPGQPRRAPAQPRDARHARASAGGRRSRRSRSPTAATDARGARRRARRRRLRGLPAVPELPRRPSRTSRRSCPPPRRPARSSIVQCDPLPLGILRPPGEFGVDVAVGEGQSLGNRLDFGGPSFGFFAAQEAYMRRMPGRIAGETTDVDGRRGFVLTLQTREQHIRREKATHNICTAQALNALAGVIYLSWLGREGLVELGELLLQRTAYARDALAALDGVELLHEQPVVREFAVDAGRRRRRRDRALRRGGRQPRLPARPRLPRASRTACWWRSPSSATRPTSTAWPGRCRPPSARRCTHERRRPGTPDRDRPAARPRAHDLREVAARPARVRRARARRAAGATACCPTTCAAPSRRGCPRSPSPRSCATTTGCPSATSTWTRASTRSARAR